jgi:hypothetical protein
MIRLTICIPTVVGRENSCLRLVEDLQSQIRTDGLEEKVEILVDKDNKEVSIGAKRDRMYKKAKGLYCVQIDDDDSVSIDYIKEVYIATLAGSDCIGYKERCLFDGKNQKISDFSLKHKEWKEYKIPVSGINYVRSPFCKTPILTSICQQVGVRDMRFGEDYKFAMEVLPHLKTETYIDKVMYHYFYTKEEHNQKYGIK